MVILGIVLVLTGAGLMVAEAHLPTYGLLGLAGLASLVAGGAIAVDGSGG
jgi:membrane-bound serine protease (ClpP class)